MYNIFIELKLIITSQKAKLQYKKLGEVVTAIYKDISKTRRVLHTEVQGCDKKWIYSNNE